MRSPARTILFLLPPTFELLDLAGPVEVFSSVPSHSGKGLAYRVQLLSTVSEKTVVSAAGVTIGPTKHFSRFGGKNAFAASRLAGSSPVAVLLLHLLLSCIAANAQTTAAALVLAVRGTQASAVVLDLQTGKVIASVGDRSRSAPGSVIKPLLLAYALEHEIVRPEMEVYCRRNLHVGGRSLPCTHPPDRPVFDAETALAESCNTWFAEMARRYTGPQLEAALQATDLRHVPMTSATVEQRQLAVLGLEGVSASPLELAEAYRNLLLRSPPDGTIGRGLADSVAYGMANQAAVKGITILGKTGTASNPGEAWTHGWFAGAVPGNLVLVLYVPHGDGGTAALLARKFFQATESEGKLR